MAHPKGERVTGGKRKGEDDEDDDGQERRDKKVALPKAREFKRVPPRRRGGGEEDEGGEQAPPRRRSARMSVKPGSGSLRERALENRRERREAAGMAEPDDEADVVPSLVEIAVALAPKKAAPKQKAKEKEKDDGDGEAEALGEEEAEVDDEATAEVETQSTVAVGYLANGNLVVHSKSGTPTVSAVVAAANRVFGTGTYTAARIHLLAQSTGGPSKHAEIVVWANHKDVVAIGASQPCCLDCSGFLNLNWIAHSRSDPPTRRGRKMWWDPEALASISDNGTWDDNVTVSTMS